LSQDLEEVIVVDNASVDSSYEGLEFNSGLIVHSLEQNLGFAGAANFGISKAISDVVLLLNPDLVVIPEAVKTLYEIITRNSKAAIVCGALLDEQGESQQAFQIRPFPTLLSVISDAIFLDEVTGWIGGSDTRRPLERPTAEEPRSIDQPAAAYWMLRKEAWKSVTGFDEGFYPAWFEDVDFCKRLKLRGWEILYLPLPCARHKGGASLQHMSYKDFVGHYYRNQLVYWRKHHPMTLPVVWLPVKLGALIRRIFIRK
jgi:N-acetylglucosaminyl-diphospho-decaprenol L-rhamnosyltransferase